MFAIFLIENTWYLASRPNKRSKYAYVRYELSHYDATDSDGLFKSSFAGLLHVFNKVTLLA